MSDRQVLLHEPYYAIDVANHLVQHFIANNKPITSVLLYKILCYVQADSLRQTSKSLFWETIYKWGTGPIIPEVYSYFNCNWPAGPITTAIKYVSINSDNSWTLIDPAKRILTKLDILRIDALADEIYDKFHKDPWQLVVQTQQEAIWQKDKSLIKHGVFTIPYTDDEIKDYFNKLGNWQWEN